MQTKAFLAALLVPAVSAQLNDLAVRAGLKYFGTALREGAINSDTRYAAILGDTGEFGQLVPENGQKWESTQPSQGQFTYAQGDITANTAKANGQGLRCHTLVWYSQLPQWVSTSFLGLSRSRPPTNFLPGLGRVVDQGSAYRGDGDAHQQRHGPLQGPVLRLGRRKRGRV
jgi:GH35 family endo-1,4-beta-xylanase